MVEKRSSAEPADEEVTVVEGGWSLVESGGWQVSIGPDGLIMLPRHVAPDELDDFIAAMKKAAAVGTKVRKRNAEIERKRVRTPGQEIASTLLVTPSDEVPEGAIRLGLSSPTAETGIAKKQSSAIGRER